MTVPNYHTEIRWLAANSQLYVNCSVSPAWLASLRSWRSKRQSKVFIRPSFPNTFSVGFLTSWLSIKIFEISWWRSPRASFNFASCQDFLLDSWKPAGDGLVGRSGSTQVLFGSSCSFNSFSSLLAAKKSSFYKRWQWYCYLIIPITAFAERNATQ